MSICTPRAWAFLRQKLGIGKARPDHQQGVALHHQVIARLGAEKTDGPGHPGQPVRRHGLAKERLGHPGAEDLRDRNNLIGSPKRPGAHQHRHLAAGVQHLGRAMEVRILRHDFGAGVAHSAEHSPMLTWRLLVSQVLQIAGEDEDADSVLRHGDANPPVHHVAHLGGDLGLLHVIGHVGEHPVEVELLLVVRAASRPGGLADDGQHRRMVELGVVEAGDEVRRAGAPGREADADLAGELRVGAGHERRHLLVAHLDELDLSLSALESAEHAVDAIARVAENPPYAPGVQPLHDEIADRLTHHKLPLECGTDRAGRIE